MVGFHRKSHMFWVYVSVHNKQEGLLPDLDSKTTIATTDNIDFLQSHASVNSGVINSVVGMGQLYGWSSPSSNL